MYSIVLGMRRSPPLENWRAQLRKGALELVVLASLAKGERYGLALVEDLHRALGDEVSQGTVYPLLNRLRRNGWLRFRWEPSRGGHPRKYYSLTVDGARQLGRMLAMWEEVSQRIEEHVTLAPLSPELRK